MENQEKKVGRVVLAVKAHGYGFILTDDDKRFFFHKTYVVGGSLPEKDTLVRFDAVKIKAKRKRDRAINVEAIQ